jgi:antitoxin (DNA-binding transcriptional repressor) of toxin-antitoxin stability system
LSIAESGKPIARIQPLAIVREDSLGHARSTAIVEERREEAKTPQRRRTHFCHAGTILGDAVS